MKLAPYVAVASVFLSLTGPSWAQDVTLGEELYKMNCRACHGPTGKGLASFPKIIDHPVDYIIDRVTRYRGGEKFGPNSALMTSRVKSLSDDDIQNVAHFIETLK